jgi:hypothetical protein
VDKKNDLQLKIKSHEKRLVFGEVFSPLQVDTQGEAMTKGAIEDMAHTFLLEGRTDKVDVSHSFKKSGCLVVESFIARKSDPDGFIEGAWVLGVKVIPDKLWELVKKGELNCFSFGGQGRTVPKKVKIEQIIKLEGETEKSHEDGPLPPHKHIAVLHFKDGTLIPGRTGVTLDHDHGISKESATEQELDHSHRMITIENKE